jgi:predicted nucleic acid-binding protein
MRDFLLDTQTIHYWYDTDCDEHAAVIGNVESLVQKCASRSDKPKVMVSVVSLGEIEFGYKVQLHQRANEFRRAKLKFIDDNQLEPLDVTRDAVVAYGEIRARVFEKFVPGDKRKPKMRPEQLVDPVTSLNLTIQENDLWLCAQAVGHGLVLVTNDGMRPIREATMNMDPALQIQNWTIAGTAAID